MGIKLAAMGCCLPKADKDQAGGTGYGSTSVQRSTGSADRDMSPEERAAMREKTAKAAEGRAKAERGRGMARGSKAMDDAEKRDKARANLDKTGRENAQMRYDD